MARIVILDFSGIYGRMKFWKNEDVLRLDFQTMEGTNCYCDDEAAEEIGKQLGELGAEEFISWIPATIIMLQNCGRTGFASPLICWCWIIIRTCSSRLLAEFFPAADG